MQPHTNVGLPRLGALALVDPLSLFAPPVAAWFESSFRAPTAAQAQGWPAIAAGADTLILAPTGSGKTLTAFLWGLNQLMTTPPPEAAARTRLVYVSPLRALAVDVDRNLRAPLAGIALAAERLGTTLHLPTIGIRTGDTPADLRRALIRRPPDILITTPESLYLMLTSAARSTLTNTEAVIVDEIHALAATKRGAHLALSMERLAQLPPRPPQRIGLSATQRPLEEIARFLGGFEAGAQDAEPRPRPVRIVDAGVRKPLELEVVVPVQDLAGLGCTIAEPGAGASPSDQDRRSIWPAIHPRLLELIKAHRSTIIFVNARRLAERLASRLNELEAEQNAATADASDLTLCAEPIPELVKAHHGSLARERRLLIEDELKSGHLRALVATSSLELGIDMGAVDLVIQVESPGSVARGLQRIGRAGHQVGEASRGKVFPKHRSDLVEVAVVTQRMRDGLIESTRYPRNPLDVLCQQIVAMAASHDELDVPTLARTIRSAANFAELSDEQLTNVLDLLSGRYPSEEFAELRPRIIWDRLTGTLKARPGAQRLAVTNAGTIPDRGLYGVFLPDGGRVGELDEEMVYESRPGETFLLGASTWRIEAITFDRVVVTPAPGRPGKMPFWHGDGPGRPLELGLAIGAFTRHLRTLEREQALELLGHEHFLDRFAAGNLVQYLDDQGQAGGVVPDDRTIVIERFRDEIGDWRVCILCPFGAQVLAPWAMALRHRLTELWGHDPEMIWSDDGIVIRLPESIDSFPEELLRFEPEEIHDAVVAALPATAMFAARFREAAGRALLLPRRRPDRRTPLWQQRQRAADLLTVASRYPSFPLLLETTRECLNDVFDLPALRQILADLRARRVRMVSVETSKASPFAASLLFGWIAVYLYEGDTPLAERRAAALALDRELLRDLLGEEQLRELLDPQALAELELELQLLTDARRMRHAEDLWDGLRRLGPLTREELHQRSEADPGLWIDGLQRDRRIIETQIAGQPYLAVAEEAGRLRDGLGAAIPLGLPAAFTESTPEPLVEFLARFARTRGPFVAAEAARRFGIGVAQAEAAFQRLEQMGRLVRGEFRPGGVEQEWCDPEVLRQLRRRSLAALRREVEPTEQQAFARFLPVWQGVGRSARGVDALADALSTLAGAAIPASVLEADVLPARLVAYRAADLDALCTAGEVVWVGAGSIGSRDGRIRLAFRDQAPLLLHGPALDAPTGPLHDAIIAHLGTGGASFWAEVVAGAQRADAAHDDASVLAALWDLVWAGVVTNDSLAPLRALLGGTHSRRVTGSSARNRPRPGRLTRAGPAAGAGRWSLVSTVLAPTPSETATMTARALQLVQRYGVLTRESALGEGAEGGFAGVYPVLKALEERGQLRRGYFVQGLGAAQFALPGAIERLRSLRSTRRHADGAAVRTVLLAATDPAQPFGATLAWPPGEARPQRIAGAQVVIHDGEAIAYLDRSRSRLITFPACARLAADGEVGWTGAFAVLIQRRRLRQIEIVHIDGAAALDSMLAPALRAGGFRDGYRGLILRSEGLAHPPLA